MRATHFRFGDVVRQVVPGSQTHPIRAVMTRVAYHPKTNKHQARKFLILLEIIEDEEAASALDKQPEFFPAS